MKSVLTLAALLLSCVSTQAQGVNGFQSAYSGQGFIGGPGPYSPGVTLPAFQSYVSTYLPTTQPDGTFAITATSRPQYVSLDQFASTQQLQGVQAQQDQLAARQEQFAFFMRRDFDRLAQGIALASALTVMPPNPGDRFALTVSGAGFDGRGAGAISGSYRVRDDILVFGGYSRSETQQLVKGGATFSFR